MNDGATNEKNGEMGYEIHVESCDRMMMRSDTSSLRRGEDESNSSSGRRSKSTLIPNGATESGCPLVESDYHCNNEYE